MKNSPIKVVVRMRPTSNFAHQQLNIDEQTGYNFINPEILTFMQKNPWIKALSIIPKINGDSNSKKFS